uniref:Alpha/beta hydrolase fold-3 domain-containing protein n=1 Tax=Oryza rufipogon TaxID=4529 RepID=A0A0E0R674_ORYRU
MSSDDTTPTPPGRRTKPKPPMSRLMRLSLKAVDWATDATRRADGTLNRLALSVLDPRVPAFSSPCRGVASRDVLVHPPTRLRARLFYPSAAAGKDERPPPPRPLPVIVFFHGGGFAFLSAASAAYDAACRRIARYASAAVLSVDYRRAPEHRCPAAYDDGIAALRYLDDPKNHHGGGGGGVAAPGVDSPAFPPVLLAIGGYDPLQDWQRRYAEMLRGKGKDVRVFEYPNAIHAFYVFPAFDDGRDLMIRIAEFVAESAAAAAAASGGGSE